MSDTATATFELQKKLTNTGLPISAVEQYTAFELPPVGTGRTMLVFENTRLSPYVTFRDRGDDSPQNADTPQHEDDLFSIDIAGRYIGHFSTLRRDATANFRSPDGCHNRHEHSERLVDVGSRVFP